MDVDGVDFRGVGGSHAPGDRRPGDADVQALALERRRGLRVADPRHVAVRAQHDRRGHDRAGQATPADLVDTRDMVEAHAPERVLQRSERSYLHHTTTAVWP